jgi:hypothetical protein
MRRSQVEVSTFNSICSVSGMVYLWKNVSWRIDSVCADISGSGAWRSTADVLWLWVLGPRTIGYVFGHICTHLCLEWNAMVSSTHLNTFEHACVKGASLWSAFVLCFDICCGNGVLLQWWSEIEFWTTFEHIWVWCEIRWLGQSHLYTFEY